MCDYDESLGGSLQVDGKIITTGDLLWTNQNPTSSFAQQQITINELENYDEFEIYYYSNTSRKTMSSTKMLKNINSTMNVIFQWDNHGNVGNRDIIWISSTKIQFNDAVTIIVNDVFNRGANNSWGVPLYIVGYKTGLFN